MLVLAPSSMPKLTAGQDWPRMFIKTNGVASGGAYAWTKQYQDTAGTFTADPSGMAGTTTDTPAYMADGSTIVPSGTICEAVVHHAGHLIAWPISPLDTYVGVTATTITAMNELVLGSGLVDLYGAVLQAGSPPSYKLTNKNLQITAYNHHCTAIAASYSVILTRDPFSGLFLIADIGCAVGGVGSGSGSGSGSRGGGGGGGGGTCNHTSTCLTFGTVAPNYVGGVAACFSGTKVTLTGTTGFYTWSGYLCDTPGLTTINLQLLDDGVTWALTGGSDSTPWYMYGEATWDGSCPLSLTFPTVVVGGYGDTTTGNPDAPCQSAINQAATCTVPATVVGGECPDGGGGGGGGISRANLGTATSAGIAVNSLTKSGVTVTNGAMLIVIVTYANSTDWTEFASVTWNGTPIPAYDGYGISPTGVGGVNSIGADIFRKFAVTGGTGDIVASLSGGHTACMTIQAIEVTGLTGVDDPGAWMGDSNVDSAPDVAYWGWTAVPNEYVQAYGLLIFAAPPPSSGAFGNGFTDGGQTVSYSLGSGYLMAREGYKVLAFQQTIHCTIGIWTKAWTLGFDAFE